MFQINTESLKFMVENEWYRIGGRLYPVNDNASLRMFSHYDTSDIVYSDAFINDFNKLNLQNYHCYSNAELIHELCQVHGINSKYYAGWQFLSQPFPIHHAWVVVDNKAIIDPTVSRREIDVYQNIHKDNPNLKKVVADKIARVRSSEVLFSNDVLMGQIFKDYIVYIGSEDSKDSARRLIGDLRSKYPDHEINRLGKPRQKTDFQKMIDEKR